MRSKATRINRQPCRSPSPDIANRHIIQQTYAPTEEALKHSRALSQSQNWSVGGVDMWEGAIAEWEKKYRLLQEQLNQLLIENSALKKEIQDANAELFKKDEELAESRNSRDQEGQIGQYQKRFGLLVMEIQRIQALLQQQKDRNDSLEQENEGFRKDPIRYARNTRSIYPEDQTPKKLAQIELMLKDEFDKMEKEMEQKVRLVLDKLENQLVQLEDRMVEVQNCQEQLQEKMNKNQFVTPKIEKGNRWYDSTGSGARSVSPSEIKKFGRKIIPLDEEKKHLEQKMRHKDDEIQRLKIQNRALDIALGKLQNQVKPSKESKECPKCQILLNEMAHLQMEMDRLKRAKTEDEISERSLKNQLERQHQSFSFNLEDYLKRIRDIKTILNNQEFRQFVRKVNQLHTDNISLKEKIDELLKLIERAQQEAKKREVEQNIMINSLKSENEVLKAQINQQENQIAKLQEIIGQKLQEDRLPVPQIDSRVLSDQSDPRVFQRYIEQAIKKLQNLEESMETTLRQ